MTLSAAEATQAFEIILAGEATPAQIGAFLMALRVRGETVEEITAGAQVMRRHALPSKHRPCARYLRHGRRRHRHLQYFHRHGAGRRGVWRTCSQTRQPCPVVELGLLSSAGAFGRASRYRSRHNENCIREAGIGFMFAPNHHAAMRHVGPAPRNLASEPCLICWGHCRTRRSQPTIARCLLRPLG